MVHNTISYKRSSGCSNSSVCLLLQKSNEVFVWDLPFMNVYCTIKFSQKQ